MFGDLLFLFIIVWFSFKGDVQNIQCGMVFCICGCFYVIEVWLYIFDGGVQGVIVVNVDFMGGFVLWVDEQWYLYYIYFFLGVEIYWQVFSELFFIGDVMVWMLFDFY